MTVKYIYLLSALFGLLLPMAVRAQNVSNTGAYPQYASPYVFHKNTATDIGYAYNSNGSMTRNPDRHIGLIEYDGFNNPCLIQFTDGSVTEYVYDASGVKLKTLHRTAVPGIEVPYGTVYEHTASTVLSSDSTLYAGPFVLSGGSLRYKYDGGSVLIPLDGSPVKPCFYALDHLGSVRLVVSADGQVIERNDYYPSGCLITENIDGETVIMPYKYTGKELDPMHGLYTYDYGARQYDPATMLWDRMDPLCEKYYNVSPYVYCLNNPVRLVDYKGMAPGDFFLTIDKAAIDFGLYYNDNSIRERTEYGSTIIKVVNKKGQKGYTYTVANRGNKEGVTLSQAPFGYKAVAEIHTHGHCTENDDTSYYDNDFSGMPRDDEYNIDDKVNLKTIKDNMDIGNANRRQRDSYLVTPNGSLKKYSPKTGKVTLLSTGMPSDSNDPDRKNNKSSFIETNPINANTEFLQILKILTYGVY